MYSTEIIRKYAEYIFSKFHQNKQSGELTYQNFKSLIKLNPKIYNQCFDGFHEYLWVYQNGVPLYKSITNKLTGYCI